MGGGFILACKVVCCWVSAEVVGGGVVLGGIVLRRWSASRPRTRVWRRERENVCVCVESHVGLFSSSGVVVSGRRCGVL